MNNNLIDLRKKEKHLSKKELWVATNLASETAKNDGFKKNNRLYIKAVGFEDLNQEQKQEILTEFTIRRLRNNGVRQV